MKGDSSVCKDIADERWKDWCFGNIAVNNKDFKLCENFVDTLMDKFFEESKRIHIACCIGQTNIRVRDPHITKEDIEKIKKEVDAFWDEKIKEHDWRMKEDPEYRHRIMINSSGFYDDEFPELDGKDINIVLLGDSFIFDVGNPYGKRLSEVLEQRFPDGCKKVIMADEIRDTVFAK